MVERMEMNVGMLWLVVVVDCCIAWRGGGSRQRDLVDVSVVVALRLWLGPCALLCAVSCL